MTDEQMRQRVEVLRWVRSCGRPFSEMSRATDLAYDDVRFMRLDEDGLQALARYLQTQRPCGPDIERADLIEELRRNRTRALGHGLIHAEDEEFDFLMTTPDQSRVRLTPKALVRYIDDRIAEQEAEWRPLPEQWRGWSLVKSLTCAVCGGKWAPKREGSPRRCGLCMSWNWRGDRAHA